jgi:hypothetical protein
VFRNNKVPWIIGGVLILALGIGAMALGGGSKSKTKSTPATMPESARAVVVTADRPHTVLVPPCNTPVQATVESARNGQGVPGATVVELPRGEGVRTVLVAHCQPGQGSVNVEGNVPSAAFVLPDEERVPEQEGGVVINGVVAKSQLVLRGGASARIIVVPPCKKEGGAKGQDEVLGEQERGVVVASTC